jgi:predicted sulfurtransferase
MSDDYGICHKCGIPITDARDYASLGKDMVLHGRCFDESENARTPRRIQRKRAKGWRKPEGVIDVTRGSRWGNPYKVVKAKDGYAIEVDGIRTSKTFADKNEAARAAVGLFRSYAKHMIKEIPEWIEPLRGKDVMCYCSEDAKCHADVLIELANQ